MRRTSYT